jgi:hypothetical protein
VFCVFYRLRSSAVLLRRVELVPEFTTPVLTEVDPDDITASTIRLMMGRHSSCHGRGSPELLRSDVISTTGRRCIERRSNGIHGRGAGREVDTPWRAN